MAFLAPPCIELRNDGNQQISRHLREFSRYRPVSRLLLGCMGCIFHIPRHLLFISARVNNFLLSGRFEVGTAKGMGKVSRAK
jgi:hypothetical protein